jgi:hypothetical protein
MDRIEFGEFIVADPQVCHGRLTFTGTRLFVSDVLEMVAERLCRVAVYGWPAVPVPGDHQRSRGKAMASCIRPKSLSDETTVSSWRSAVANIQRSLSSVVGVEEVHCQKRALLRLA